MSDRIKACFDEAPEPSDDLRRRVRQLPTRKKRIPVPMQLRIFTGVAAAVLICGFWGVRFLPHQGRHKTPHVASQSAPKIVDAPPRVISKLTVGERTLCIYSIHMNNQGEVVVLYTAGKRPADAWIKDKQGRDIYQDSSVTTQDWEWNAVNIAGEGASGWRHLPMYQPSDLRVGTVPSARIAPDGCKYEVILFRFGKKSRRQKSVKIQFSAPPKNYHGPALYTFVKTKFQFDGPLVTKTFAVTEAHGEDEAQMQERVPRLWERYGVNVAESIRQLEEEDPYVLN